MGSAQSRPDPRRGVQFRSELHSRRDETTAVFPSDPVPGGMTFEEIPDAWTVWSDEDGGRAVLAYRPDVFDGGEFPAECMPTIYVTKGPKERRRPPTDRRALADADWRVTLFLEPAVDAPERSFESRSAAIAGATDLAREFHEGEVDYRSLYQVPREDYFEKLDELTGRSPH